MKKITKKEFEKLDFFREIRKVSKWNQELNNLPLNQALIISEDEWDMKTKIKAFFYTVVRKRPFKVVVRRMKTGKEWAILKIPRE